MNEQIKKLIKDEVAKQIGAQSMNNMSVGGTAAMYQAGTPQILPHAHDGVSSEKINSNNIVPGNRINGTITFDAEGIYTIPVNFNPTSITFYGGGAGPLVGGVRYYHANIIGNALIGRNSYQWNPNSAIDNLSLNRTPGHKDPVTGNTISPIIQGCGSFFHNDGSMLDGVPNTTAFNSQNHIIYVAYPNPSLDSDVMAYADVTSVSNSSITITVGKLARDWHISGLFIIT
jgi:hypothetical protein